MKKLLIISPHFPPVNAADMQRVRQSLPFFENLGWKATVVAVDPQYIEMAQDENLLKTIPENMEIHHVAAFPTHLTRKFGLGNLGLRSLWFYWKWGKQNLKKNSFDLIYFSTTVFPSLTMGRLWKKKYGIPFVVDMQDPWRNDYYLKFKPAERPKKFWFDYQLNKRLEAYAMPRADGLISVAPGYIEMLKERYPVLRQVPSLTLTFGAADIDFKVLESLNIQNRYFKKGENINIVYVGVTPPPMWFTIRALFKSVSDNRKTNDHFKRIRFFFLGTSYAPRRLAVETVTPLAKEFGIEDIVFEEVVRLPYFETLTIIKEADFAIIPGTQDADYTASKLFPYILAKINILAIFHKNSNVSKIIDSLSAGDYITFSDESVEELSLKVAPKIKEIIARLPFQPQTNWENFSQYKADFKTREQVKIFEEVLTRNKRKAG
ncbi:MAG: glycosyltransferase [Bacteroidetes bacterium]|nr:glycosyltransferase [Bacteroidota bacterium]